MSLNCRLNRNISLVQLGESGDTCEGQDISMGVGGLRSPVLVYNISDVESLKFENDNRADDSLVVDTINSTGQFYKIDFTSASYNEEYDNHKWTHTLTLDIANITPLFEDLLSDGTNGRYLVCFKPNGSEDYRCFGWKYGATLDYSLNIAEDSFGYTVTLEDVSEYPLFSVYADNFGSKDKVYTPLFKPLWDVYLCEQDSEGKHTGYAIAMYVVKVNAAGQPLGSDNKLCQWSGKKQDAYKYEGITSDGGYNIIGTYGKNATFDGRPVKVFDIDKCSADVDNSIYINQKKNELISLNSTITSSTFTITSTDDWSMMTMPQYVTIIPTTGHNGNTICEVWHNGVGGIDYIDFMNNETHEIVTLEVIINILKIGEEYRYPHSTTDIILTPTVEGCNTAFTYTITPSVTHSVDSEGNIHITFPNTDDDLEYTLTTTHGCDSNEKKITKIYRAGIDDVPNWIVVDEYCEFANGSFTGYRITVSRDYNPNSPTYSTEKTERTADADCNEESPTWEETESYCEKDVNGVNTGYFIVVQTDLNEKSKTYGETRETRTYNPSECQGVDPTPFWVIDDELDPYCEKKIYEPSMVEGNTGRIIFQLVDSNIYSPTYNQRVESALTESEWTAELQSLFGDFPCEKPDTDPIIEDITKYCETEEVSGTLRYTGYAIVTGMDKNPYSPTYLETVTVRRLDEECGGGETCSCDDLQVVTGTCSCDDLQTVDSPAPSTDFDTLLAQFNEVLSDRGKVIVGSSTTPQLYSYLESGYNRALTEYNGNSPLFDENNYNEVYNYHGNDTTYHDTAKSAMLSWLMAMQLSEIYADSGKTTNTQTELFKTAYNIGGGRSVPVYNYNDMHSDVFIARYAASAIYAIKRAEKSFSDMDGLRSEVYETPIDKTSVSWTDSCQVTEATCDGHYDSSNSIGYALNLNDIFPAAAGPYADNFYNGGLICRTVASRTPDPQQPSDQFNQTTHNYLMDEAIDQIVVNNYNLSSSDLNLSRTVQAVADDEDDINQMLGGITYYKYNASSPKTSFTVGTPTDNNGSFHGTFNCNVLGKDLSSLISNTNNTESDIAYFFSGVGYIGGHSRQTILDPQYGRRRPGQGEGDALYNGNTVVLTSTPRCLCNSGCDTRQNYLIDTSITRLVGGGTKLNSNHYYYVDNNGDGEQDSGEPYYNDGVQGTTNECAGLHASTYPSGHSSEVWTVALFLMQMLPSRYAEIYKAAYDYTVSRTIVRAHWNSDTMYGKLVATTMTPVINKFRYSHNNQNFRTFYNAAKTMVDNAPSCGESIKINLTIHNSRSTSIILKKKITVALYNDNHYGWDGCYNRYNLIDSNEQFTLEVGGSYTFYNLEFDGSSSWTTTRHFLDVDTCQLFKDSYPTNSNVFVYDVNGVSETYIPLVQVDPTIGITNGQTFAITL